MLSEGWRSGEGRGKDVLLGTYSLRRCCFVGGEKESRLA